MDDSLKVSCRKTLSDNHILNLVGLQPMNTQITVLKERIDLKLLSKHESNETLHSKYISLSCTSKSKTICL